METILLTEIQGHKVIVYYTNLTVNKKIPLQDIWWQVTSNCFAPSYCQLCSSVMIQHQQHDNSLSITGCMVAQHCCKSDQPFQWENPKFDPHITPIYPKPLTTPHHSLPFFQTKICTDDYVWHISWCAKFGENPFTGGFHTNKWNITLAWLFVPFLSFPLFFLPSSTEKTTELILTHDGSYDAISRKEVPFGGYKI